MFLSGAQGASKPRRSHPRHRASLLLHSLRAPHPWHRSRLASPVRRRRGLRRALMPLMRMGFELNGGEGKEMEDAAHAGMRICRARLLCCAPAEPCWRVLPTEQAPMRQRMTPCHGAAIQYDLAARAREPTFTRRLTLALQCCRRLRWAPAAAGVMSVTNCAK